MQGSLYVISDVGVKFIVILTSMHALKIPVVNITTRFLLKIADSGNVRHRPLSVLAHVMGPIRRYLHFESEYYETFCVVFRGFKYIVPECKILPSE